MYMDEKIKYRYRYLFSKVGIWILDKKSIQVTVQILQKCMYRYFRILKNIFMPYIKLCSITHLGKQCFFSSLIASLLLSLPFHATFRLLPVTLSFKNDLIELKFVKKNMYLKTELDFEPGYPEKHSCGRIIFSNIFKLLNVFEYLFSVNASTHSNKSTDARLVCCNIKADDDTKSVLPTHRFAACLSSEHASWRGCTCGNAYTRNRNKPTEWMNMDRDSAVMYDTTERYNTWVINVYACAAAYCVDRALAVNAHDEAVDAGG